MAGLLFSTHTHSLTTSFTAPSFGFRSTRVEGNTSMIVSFRNHQLRDLFEGHAGRIARCCISSVASVLEASQPVAVKPSPSPVPAQSPESPASAYIHIPFCRRRCHYCDFAILPIGNRTASALNVQRMGEYVDLVKREMTSTMTLMEAKASRSEPGFSSVRTSSQQRGLSKQALSTVYFGGGTPSLLPPALLDELLSHLDGVYGIHPTAEISMEIDPGTFDGPQLRAFLDAGVTRVSLGVQAFQDTLLKACGRAHGLEDVRRAVDLVQEAEVKNWTLDLISSLPHQTEEDWDHSLTEAVRTGAPHISVYDLQVEDGTAFGRWYAPGESPLPSDDAAANFYRMASQKLTSAGYEHYEISSYAKPGFASRHNSVYWELKPYLAFGMSAASYLGGSRFTRPKSLQGYQAWVEGLEHGRTSPFEEDGILPPLGAERTPTQTGIHKKEELLEYLMLRLRLAAGVDLRRLEEQYGSRELGTVVSALKPYLDSGHVQYVLEGNRGHVVRLSDPEGFLISNNVLSSLFHALE